MTRRTLLSLLFLFGSLAAQQADRVARWQEDLDAFARMLRGTFSKDFPPGQRDLGKLYPNLDKDLAQLKAELPQLRDGQIHLRLARILASGHVAHNMGYIKPNRVLPLAIEWLADGPMIVAGSADLKLIIGSRVVKIGSYTAAEFLKAVEPYISYETEGWKRVRAAELFQNANLLEELGAVQNGSVALTLEGASGTFVQTVATVASTNAWMSLREALGLPVLLALSKPEQSYYWYDFMSTDTLYIQYNRCAHDPKQPFGDFVTKVFAESDERRARRVVVDLRFNTGGNSAVIRPLIDALKKREKTLGVPLVLIGPITFSSGVLGARDFRKKARARLVGSPTGGWQGGYGESPNRKLPNSGFEFQWTIKKFGSGREIKPDITVEPTFEDVRAGRDAVLDAALRAPR